MKRFGILFDMDGVLVDSEPVITAAAVEGLRSFGIPAEAEDFKPFTGMGEDAFLGNVARKYGVEYTLGMKDTVYDIYGSKVDDELIVYEGMLDTLSSLRELGYNMVLASSADRVKVEHNLRVAKIDPALFDKIITGSDIVQKKPFPEIYLKAASAISKPPSDCIVVEDAISGIKAGLTAGARVVAVTTAFPKEKLLSEGANWVIETIAGLLPLLDTI